MTIEEKARAYDEALEKAKDMLKYKEVRAEDMEYLFPELKESRDERIRKCLLSHFSRYREDEVFLNDILMKDIVSWLEKQGKETSWKPFKEEMDALYGLAYITNKMDDKKDEAVTRLYQDLKREFFSGVSYENMFPSSPTDAPIKLEKQGEQKPAEKVEPKFHKGEWITHNTANFVFKIINFGTNGYEVINRENFKKTISFDNEENYHLWTIQDAKDGDVLAVEPIGRYKFPFIAIYKNHSLDFFNSYCFIGFDGKFYEADTEHVLDDTHPATKEQRDLLFQKMKEAGYKWDAEKKELKKIEQSLTWSEEDEKIYQSIMDDTVQENQLDGKQIDWLRDIKYRHFSQPQNTWKPSDLQIKALEYYTKGGCVDKEGIFGSELVKLLEELKKL